MADEKEVVLSERRKTVLAMDRAGEVILGDRSHAEREREYRQLSCQECDAKAGNVQPD
ncbi:hypothetical protein ABH994_005511 [Bradyrhizobium yuanmingense]